ncbi:MAG TPA: prolipoprotein diacylglyceryl transferase [Syntrophomonadaceae bacterium]|nr:prolipoprotein diacylglyceryl transferase [Syntrophomonadaceae bacterium]
MYPVLFKIGSFSVYAWGFMLAIAVIISIYGVGKLFEREGYDKEIVVDMVLIIVIAGIIGARIAYILVYEWTTLITNPLSLFSIRSGGISGLIWYGGVIGGAIPFFIYMYKKKLPFWLVADMLAPFIALSYALVRVGCFLNGCCYGNITDSIFGVVFPYVDAFARHPAQIYSSILNLILFGFLIWFYPRRKFDGQVIIYYILGYSVYRFIVEFFRESIIMCGSITLGQVYTLILLAIGLILYFWRKSNAKKV